jgi:diacylglycerol kinase (ATP)
MVSHSRLLLRYHTLREVFIGAVTGILITLAVLLLFKLAG